MTQSLAISESRCAVHPELPASGACGRCGAFFCAGDRMELESGVYCAVCGARPDVDYLEAFRARLWGKRDAWCYLAVLWFLVHLGTAMALAASGEVSLFVLLALAGAGISAAYFVQLPWARLAIVAYQVAMAALTFAANPSMAMRGMIGVAVTASLLRNTRNRLAFRQEVTRPELEKAWNLYANNTVARTGFMLSFLGLFFPVVGLIAAVCCGIGFSRVDPHAHPPIGRKGMAIAGLALGVVGTGTSFVAWYNLLAK